MLYEDEIQRDLKSPRAIAFANTHVTANVRIVDDDGVGGELRRERYTSNSEGSIQTLFPSW